MKTLLLKTSFLLSLLLFCGWGGTGHKIINRKTTESFPTTMHSFMYWSSLLESHASDADNRKNTDPNESPRHYIDIDEYPEFVQNDSINQSYEYNIILHGQSFVIGQGILPWTIIRTVDSVRIAFEQRDFNKAMLKAADLGHYVGDGHMPLHITRNYNGQYTGQTGIHSRYESTMIGKFYQQIIYTNDTASYIDDKSNYVFNFIYTDYKYVDSLLQAEAKAKLVTGSTSSTAYYDSLWLYTGQFTTMLFKNASKRLADLIYTAWIDAGSPDPNVTSVTEELAAPLLYNLFQNYPNPFNPSTKIVYQLPVKSDVTLKIYDLIGNEIETLYKGEAGPGVHEVNFNAASLPSGVYVYTLQTRNFSQSRKFLLVK